MIERCVFQREAHRSAIATLLLLLLPAIWVSASATENTELVRWELQGSAPLSGIRSFDFSGNAVSLLFGRAVAVANANSLGMNLAVRSLTPLETSYDDCYQTDSLLILFARGGALALARANPDTVVVLNEQTWDDSLFSIAHSGEYFFLAEGVEGIEVVSIDQFYHLRPVGRVEHGAYYTQVAVHDTLLLATDQLNGIDIFHTGDGSLIYLRTLFTRWPVTDFAVVGEQVIVCYGRNEVDRLRLADSGYQTPQTTVFENQVVSVERSGLSVMLASSDGTIQHYDFADGTGGEFRQLPYPPLKMRSELGVSYQPLCFALDARGGLIGFAGDQLRQVKTLDLAELPTAMAAADSGLLIARPGVGLSLLHFGYGSAIERQIWETGLGISALAVRDSLIFAAEIGTSGVTVLSFGAGAAAGLTQLDMLLPADRLFVEKHGERFYDIVAVGSSGATALRFDVSNLSSKLLWTVDSPFRVTGCFYGGSALILASETGEIDYYCLDCGFPKPIFITDLTVSERVRSLLMIDDRWLVVGSPSGVSLFEYLDGARTFEPQGTLLTVDAVSDMRFDPEKQSLIIATGEDAICFSDMSDPRHPGIVSRISFSQGTTHLSLGRSSLYALTSDAVSCYQQIAGNLQQAALTLDVSEPYPNPFNMGTVVEVTSPADHSIPSRVAYEILDILGRAVRRGEFSPQPGKALIFWDGTDSGNRPAASGVYFLRLVNGESVTVRKMLLIK